MLYVILNCWVFWLRYIKRVFLVGSPDFGVPMLNVPAWYEIYRKVCFALRRELSRSLHEWSKPIPYIINTTEVGSYNAPQVSGIEYLKHHEVMNEWMNEWMHARMTSYMLPCHGLLNRIEWTRTTLCHIGSNSSCFSSPHLRCEVWGVTRCNKVMMRPFRLYRKLPVWGKYSHVLG